MNYETDYRRFERLSIKLGIPVINVFLTISVSEKGRITYRRRRRSRTWNRNFWNWMICVPTQTPGVATNWGAGYLSFKQAAGTVTAISGPNLLINPTGIASNSVYGILVGIGTAAESFEGYALSNQCIHGTGGNQLSHLAHEALVQAYVAGSKTWTVTMKRKFNNNSGSAIVIAETALLYTGGYTTGILLNRDLLASTVNVANGAQLTVSYDISLVFPA